MTVTGARFEVPTAVMKKIQVLWDVIPCGLIITDVSKEHNVSERHRSSFYIEFVFLYEHFLCKLRFVFG